MLCTASPSSKLAGSHPAVLIRIMALSDNVNTWENKPNTNKKNKSTPFSLRSSQRPLDFPLKWDFVCLPTAATKDMMYWETGHILKLNTS